MTYSTSRLSSFLLSLLVLTPSSSLTSSVEGKKEHAIHHSHSDLDYIVKAHDSDSFQRIVTELSDSITTQYPASNMALFKVSDGNMDIVQALVKRDEVEFVQKGE